MKQNKKWILIAAVAVAAVAVIAAAIAAILLPPKTPDYTFAPFVSKYEDKKNYDSLDSNIVFDGVLDEDIWQNRRWLEVNHISEEFIGVKMTTYFGEDGLYMAFDVDDYGVYYDKYRYIDYNSGLQIYLSPLIGAKDITDCGYEISLNAGEMVGVKQFDGNRFEEFLGRVYMESQIKGEMNSAKATGYTIEAYIDYALLGENCKEVFAYPAIIHTTSATESERQWYSFGLNEKGVSWTRADTWWSFDQQGLVGHEVIFETDNNGTVEGADFVPNGDDYTFTLAPQAGYYAETVKVNEVDAASSLYYFQGKTLCTVEWVEEQLKIQVTYAPVPDEQMEVSGTLKNTDGNPLNAQIWAVAGGYTQMLSVDAQGNFSGSVPAIEGLELFASAEGYVSEEVPAQEGPIHICLKKMYFGNNEQVVRSSTNMALWDLTRMYQDRVRMISTEYAMQLVHSGIYGKNVHASAKLFTDVEEGADTRAGFTFYVNEGLSVFVALTMHGEVNEYNPNGELSCSVQIIAEQNGERIWGNGGTIVPIENPERIMKLAITEGVPFAVHYNMGAFDVWVDGQQVGYGIYPKDANGNNRLQTGDAVAVGLETWSSRAIYENLKLDGNYRIFRQPSAPGWDLSKLSSGIAVSESDAGAVAMLSEDYSNKLNISAIFPLNLGADDDIRAGFILRNARGNEVFVALTAHKTHYSVQVISGGWASWAVEGRITDISTWEELKELSKTDGVSMTVYAENGKLTIGINGYLVAENIVPLDADGNPTFVRSFALAPGLATPGTTLTISGISIGTDQPKLKDPVERLWDISKANDGIYTSLTNSDWASLFLTEEYSNKLSVSAKLPVKMGSEDDIRAGFVLRNEQGIEVFVALTAHKTHYSVQVISGGWASWAVSGQITDISAWDELTTLADGDGIPMSVIVKNGKFCIGINGYIVADNIVALDADGKPALGADTDVIVGIATAGTKLKFTDVAVNESSPEPENPEDNAPTEPEFDDPVERQWDISKANEGIYTSLTDSDWASLFLTEKYTDKVSISSNMPLKMGGEEDIRAGFVLRNEQGIEVFVALTAHKTHYSVQVISGGWASWAVEGQIEDLSTWTELSEMDSIPLTVYAEDGKLTIGIDGYMIADRIVPLDADGKAILRSDTNVKVGLVTSGAALTFSEVQTGSEKPSLKLPIEKFWDLSKAEQHIYTSITDGPWACLWLNDAYENEISVSAKLPLKKGSEDDIRAGFVLRSEQGIEVFVALTAHETHYSVQVISGGWASWAVSGQITDISTWDELAALADGDGIPMSVTVKNGKLSIGINSYLIAKDIIALNTEGNAVLGDDTDVIVGIATAGTALRFTDVLLTSAEPEERPTEPEDEKPTEPELQDPVERQWDISKANEGIYTSLTDSDWASLFLTEKYTDMVSISANLPLKMGREEDIRAGFVLRNEQGIEVFVALTAHKTHYSVQVISGGWASWAVEGTIEDLSTWTELSEMDSIPLTVYAENGKLIIGVNGYKIADNIVPLNTDGQPVLGSDTNVKAGLATAGTALIFTDVKTGDEEPSLKLPIEKLWDISKAGEGTYTSFTDSPWASLFLTDNYSDRISISAKLPLKLSADGEIRAGFVLRNEQGIEVFVALTAHKTHYSMQVISGGWASWAVEGQIEDLSTWTELNEIESIPLMVYAENGKLTIGINGYKIAENIVPLNTDGHPIWGSDTNVKAGLATAGTALTFTDVETGNEEPDLKLLIEKLWDISKANEGTYSSFTNSPWANLWLNESYTEVATVSAKLPLKLGNEDDIRAGFVLRNEQGIEVFVALTAHKTHYSMQVISGGWASWAVNGTIEDLSTWNELTKLESIPVVVYVENGKLTIGINGYMIADGIVPLNAAGNPTFGSNAKLKVGIATAGTALTFTDVSIGEDKPDLKQKLIVGKGGIFQIPGDYTNANYAVFEANIKALDAITYDWNSNIIVSPTGGVWDAYDFQILYGTSKEQNLIKLTGPDASMDGFTVFQEQWVNDPNLEKLFGEDGMNVKMVRMDTWAYLLVDMGSGYSIVGKMILPANQATSISLWNNSTAFEVTDYSVVTGQAAAIAAINGLNLGLDNGGMVLPIADDSWTLEGRLVIDTATFPWGTGEYRMYAGADSWGQAISVYYNRTNWYLQNHTNWANTQLADEQWWKLSAESGGMWVRFVKNGNTLTTYVSADGENWTSSLIHNNITAKGIYLFATLASQLRDVKLTTGA